MGIIRDNDLAMFDGLYKRADNARKDAMTAAETAARVATDAYKKSIWIIALVIVAVFIIVAFILSGTDHTVLGTICFIAGFVVAIYFIKKKYEKLHDLERQSAGFLNEMGNYR